MIREGSDGRPMLKVFICEADPKQRKYQEALILKSVFGEGYKIELALSTDEPTKLIDYIKQNSIKNALYFLDINLRRDMNGIQLATKIRELDYFGKIAFVTAHPEFMSLTFKHHIGAIDYIIKDNPEGISDRFYQCIETATKQNLNNNEEAQEFFKVKFNSEMHVIPLGDIMFFEVHPKISHKLIMHTNSGQIELRGSINSTLKEVGSNFFRCDKSFLVNIKNVKTLNIAKREVEMTNGEKLFVSIRKVRDLVSLCKSAPSAIQNASIATYGA